MLTDKNNQFGEDDATFLAQAAVNPYLKEQWRYLLFMRKIQQEVFWDLGQERKIWEFDEKSELPLASQGQFFVVNHPRTGSSITVKLLNAHPQIYCGMEDFILPLLMTLLGSPFFLLPRLPFPVRYQKKLALTPIRMRHLLDGWRKGVSDRPIYGDKGELYYSHFGDACQDIFPGCKFILTVRNPLDTLSSFIRQPWAIYLRFNDSPQMFHQALRERAYHILACNRMWKNKAMVIPFEEIVSLERFQEIFTRIFRHLDANPDLFDWEEGWAQCHHYSVIERWKRDSTIGDFLEWLKHQDTVLYDLLIQGDYYLPDTVVSPPIEPPSWMESPADS